MRPSPTDTKLDEPQPDHAWPQLLRRASVFLRGHKGRGGGLTGLALAVAAMNALEPLLLKAVLDALTGAAAFRMLVLGVVGILVVSILRESAQAWVNWLTWRIRLRVNYDLMEQMLRKIHALPLEFHREQGVGGLLTRLDRSVSGFLQSLQNILTNVIPAVLYLAISLVVMLQLDWRLTLVVFAFAPLPPLLGALAAPEQTRREHVLMETWVRLYSRFSEVLSGISVVRSFVMENVERRRFLGGVKRANRTVLRGVRRDSMIGALRNLMAALARVAALGYGGWLVVQGEITVGTLVAFLGYVGGLFGPVQGLTNAYQTLRRGAVALESIFGILDREDALREKPGAVELTKVAGAVRYEGVRFGYRPDQELVRGIDLDVRPGETIALVGPSGSGKTTLMALLQRLYDPWEGRILIDGHDLRDVTVNSLRTHLGVVHQDPLLFDDSIRDNIAYGRPDASLDEIRTAAEAANALTFIEALPEGYESRAGERGANLSVGERQRISLARALLKDPAILILDEPTAALDAETEAQVQDAVDRLMEGRTTFVIAHRLVTVVGADRIVVLRDGRIAEVGRHEELLESDGYYAHLVRQQVKGLLPVSPGLGRE